MNAALSSPVSPMVPPSMLSLRTSARISPPSARNSNSTGSLLTNVLLNAPTTENVSMDAAVPLTARISSNSFVHHRDRSPGACNGCLLRRSCRLNKYGYNPEKAQAVFLETLVDSRASINLTFSEAKGIADILAPLLKRGLSPHQIPQLRPDLEIGEKSIYNYIEYGMFQEVADIYQMDLSKQVSIKLPMKKASPYKKCQDRRYLMDRTYKDYLTYMQEYPDLFVPRWTPSTTMAQTVLLSKPSSSYGRRYSLPSFIKRSLRIQ